MGNNRGNVYSRNHTVLNPDESEFWKFSWHEFGIYDSPTMIDYILGKTQQPHLAVVGHSQGSAEMLVMLSKLPQYNDKVKLFIAMAPIAFMSNTESPLLLLGALLLILPEPISTAFARLTVSRAGTGEFLLTPEWNQLWVPLCSIPIVDYAVCAGASFIYAGVDPAQYNITLARVIAGHGFEGGAVYNLVHFAQSIKEGHFREYDFGILENRNKYGQDFPPDYPLDKITTDVVLIYADNDYISTTLDVERLGNALTGTNAKSIRVADRNFNHLDFLYAINLKEQVADVVIAELARF